MSFVSAHLLTALVFVPLAAALLALTFPPGPHSGVRGFVLAASLLDLGLACTAWGRFDPQAGLQLIYATPWLPALNIQYAVGVDGIALVLVMLTTFLTPWAIVSWPTDTAGTLRAGLCWLLVAQTCLLGAFVATDVFMFCAFFEASLIPTTFLLAQGGGRRRAQAALRYAAVGVASSAALLGALAYTAWLAADASGPTFAWPELARRLAQTDLGDAELLLFLAFAWACAYKVPLFGLHAWLPDAAAYTPPAAAAVWLGAVGKLGAFGLLRYAVGLFPETALAFLPALGTLAAGAGLYGALLALVQTNLRRALGFAALSQMGCICVGLLSMTTAGLSGSVLSMLNHGVATAALFLLVGRLQARQLDPPQSALGGLANPMPVFAFLFMVLVLGFVGMPGLAGFVGAFSILLGTFASEGLAVATADAPFHEVYAVLAVAALLAMGLVAAAMLRLAQRLLFGPTRGTSESPPLDLAWRERALFVPFVAYSLTVGLHPQPLLDVIQPTAAYYSSQFRRAVGMPPEVAHPMVGELQQRDGLVEAASAPAAVWPADAPSKAPAGHKTPVGLPLQRRVPNNRGAP
jgi:NADH-quinone oxidoreductase subunit M